MTQNVAWFDSFDDVGQERGEEADIDYKLTTQQRATRMESLFW